MLEFLFHVEMVQVRLEDDGSLLVQVGWRSFAVGMAKLLFFSPSGRFPFIHIQPSPSLELYDSRSPHFARPVIPRRKAGKTIRPGTGVQIYPIGTLPTVEERATQHFLSFNRALPCDIPFLISTPSLR